jgi:hypothetical protein
MNNELLELVKIDRSGNRTKLVREIAKITTSALARRDVQYLDTLFKNVDPWQTGAVIPSYLLRFTYRLRNQIEGWVILRDSLFECVKSTPNCDSIMSGLISKKVM